MTPKYSERLYFLEKEQEALTLLQTYLHHRKAVLGMKADSTTMERISRFLELGGDPKLVPRLKKASSTIVSWLWGNKAAIYKEVYSVMRKNEKVLSSGYYHEDEGFSILVLQSLRILYNYHSTHDVPAEPLSYLITTLRYRKQDLLMFDVPYAESHDSYIFTDSSNRDIIGEF